MPPPPAPSGLPPLPRKAEGKRQLGSAGAGRQAPKRVRNGQCWLWVEGRCANRNCRFKHECAVCGDKTHHAAVCPRVDLACHRGGRRHPSMQGRGRGCTSGYARGGGVLRCGAAYSRHGAGNGRQRLRDGGGVKSDADWRFPRAEDLLKELRCRWLSRFEQWGLVPRLLRAASCQSSEAWLRDGEIQCLREDLLSFLKDHGFYSSSRIAVGQPLALELWRDLFALTGDVDQALIPLLQAGVPSPCPEANGLEQYAPGRR